MKVLTPDDLSSIISVSKVTIWRMQKRGELPPRRQITKRKVGWLQSEIEEWLKSRPFVS